MRASRLVVVGVATVLCVVVGSRANADPISLSFNLIASGFGAGAPVDPLRGFFSISFDNSTDLREQTSGISGSNLNIALDSPLAYAYGRAADVLIVGALRNGAQTLAPGTDDLLFSILGASTPHPFIPFELVYSQASHAGSFQGHATLTPVPEPATLTLLGAGMALTLVRRRRRRVE